MISQIDTHFHLSQVTFQSDIRFMIKMVQAYIKHD